VLKILLMLMILPGAAMAAPKALQALPFKFSVGNMHDAEMNGSTFNVIVAKLTNGDYYLNDVSIHCEAGNAQGYTWNVTGHASNLDPHETRTFNLVSSSELDEYSLHGSKATCFVDSFKINAF
jgi:hypothetical protein